MALRDIIAGPPNLHHKQIRDMADAIDAALVGAGGGGVIDVSSFATGGDGSSGDPWVGWDTAITWAAHTEYHFRSGWFAYETSPNYLQPDIALRGEAGTYLKHTGTGDAFTMDSEDPGGTWVQRVRVENFTVVGNYVALTGTATASIGTNQVVGSGTAFLSQVAIGDSFTFGSGSPGAPGGAESRIVTAIADDTHLTVETNWILNKSGATVAGKTRHGLYLVGVRNGTFRNISVKEIGHNALHSEFCVTNTAEDFVCTYHEPLQSTGFFVRPQRGIMLTANATTTWTFIEPVIEGMQAAGFYFDTDCYGNTVINGTSEGNPGKGMVIKSPNNIFLNVDVEANGDHDIEVWHDNNVFINCLASTEARVEAGRGVKFIGGVIGNLYNIGEVLLDGPIINGTITNAPGGVLFNTPYINTLDGGNRYDAHLGNVVDWIKDLTSGATISTNARDARIFYFGTSTNFTLANPTNGVNGQAITWRITQGAAHTITYGGKFRTAPGKDFPKMPGAGEVLYLTARYHSTDDRWDLVDSNNDLFSTFEAQDISARDINATGAFYVDDTQVLSNQQAAIANPTGGSVVDVEARTAIVSLLDANRAHGLIAVTAPFNLANTIAWFPAWALTFNDNDLVNKFRDRSGNVRHLAQGDPARRPVFQTTGGPNSNPYVLFDGVDDYLISGAFAYNQPVCISLVIKRFDNSFKYLYSSIDGFGVAMFQGDGASSDLVSMYAGAGSGDPSGAISSGAWYLVTAEYDGASSKIYENGVQVGSTGNPGTNNGNGLVLGNRYDLSVPCQVGVAEGVIYLTSERSNVETYLLDQYAL